MRKIKCITQFLFFKCQEIEWDKTSYIKSLVCIVKCTNLKTLWRMDYQGRWVMSWAKSMKTGVAWGWYHGICSDAISTHPDHLHQCSYPSPNYCEGWLLSYLTVAFFAWELPLDAAWSNRSLLPTLRGEPEVNSWLTQEDKRQVLLC